jgi:hypothetical protein
MRMTCEAKIRLGAEYEAVTSKFAEAVSELRQKMGVYLKEEYERLDRAANEAPVKSEQARLALAGCGGLQPSELVAAGF